MEESTLIVSDPRGQHLFQHQPDRACNDPVVGVHDVQGSSSPGGISWGAISRGSGRLLGQQVEEASIEVEAELL